MISVSSCDSSTKYFIVDEFCLNCWRKLSREEIQKYENLRLDHEKMIEHFKRINLEIELEERLKRTQVIDFVRKLSVDDIPKKDLFVIQSQIFAKTDEESPQYVPAEISLARFSLSEGIIEVYHAFIRPGTVPLGYKRACLENSAKKHKIPLELVSEADGDTTGSEHGKYTEDGEILDQMMNILNGEHFLFSLPEFEKEITGVLEVLKKRSGRELSSVNILSLPLLMFELANKPRSEGSEAQKQEGFIPFESVAEREFEKEKFLYYPGMNCSWHDEMTDTCNCSSTRVRSYVYTLLDVCCHRYNIHLFPVTHYPPLPALPS